MWLLLIVRGVGCCYNIDKMLTLKRRGIYLALTSVLFVIATLFSPLAPHVYADTPKSVDFNDKSLTFVRVNRTIITLGGAWFYSADPTSDNYIYNSIGLTCPAVLTYNPPVSYEGGSVPSSWNIKWTSPYESQAGCQTVQSTASRDDDPKNNGINERYWTVFYANGEKINSVLKDNKTTFTKRGAWQAEQTVYIEDGVQAVDCPSVIRFSTADNKWAYIPMIKASSAANASDQYKTLMNKAFGTPENDVKCTPTDQDSLNLFKRFGLPESYYDRGVGNKNNIQTNFGFTGNPLYGAELLGGIPGIEAQGIGANGDYANGTGIGTGDGVSSGLGGDSGGSTDEKPTCTVEGIGWIVCPVMNFMAGVNDTLFGALSDMLNVPPSIFTANSGTDKYADLYAAWNAFRGYANILFIVAFLIIIYSQITSVGITNYGIKKLLPKLIIAAILVNASYYLCQIAVDLSNILGYGLKSLFVAIGGGIDTSNSATGNWASNIGGALAFVGAAAGVVALVLAISVPVVLSGLLALLMVVVILIVRRAIVILLIVISPLAFVAWLLPNTEKWFKKWWDLFLSMLVLFPVISALFGAGALAGKILGSADFGDDAGVAKLAALGASVLPLFATIPLLQGALKATGAVGAKLSGMSAAANKRFTSGAQKTGKERYDNSSFAKGRALRKQGKEEWRNRQFARALTGEDSSVLGKLRHRSAIGATNGRLSAVTKRGEFGQNRINTAAQAKMDAIEGEAAKEATERQKSLTTAEVAAMAATGTHKGTKVSDAERAAAIDRTMSTGSFAQRKDILSNLAANKGTTSRALRQRAVAGAYSKGDQNIYGAGFGDEIVSETGGISSAADLASSAVDNAAKGKVQAEHLVQNGAATDWLVDEIVTNGAAHPLAATARTNLQGVAKSAQTSQATRTKIDGTIRTAFGKL